MTPRMQQDGNSREQIKAEVDSDKPQGAVGPEGGTELAYRVHTSTREAGAQGAGHGRSCTLSRARAAAVGGCIASELASPEPRAAPPASSLFSLL